MRLDALLAGCLVTSAAGFAQEAAKPSFDVVSVRPTIGQKPVLGAARGGPGTQDPERFGGDAMTTMQLASLAYGVRPLQISGPEWLNTARYDISAKIPAGTSREQFKLMVRQVLEERFALKAHHEMKEFTAYNLVVAKGGLKLRDSIPTETCAMGARPVGGTCPEGATYQIGIARNSTQDRQSLVSTPISGGGRLIAGKATTFSAIVGMLPLQLVYDKTGITDKFDLRFQFVPPNAPADADDVPLPSIFSALEGLGLKLDATKVSLDYIVVDHIERPSDN